MESRFELKGLFTFVGKGFVLDKVTGETFEGELRFKSITPNIKTTELDNGLRAVNLDLELVRDVNDPTLYEIVVYDQSKVK
jgi:hypothetical protein